MLFNKLSPAVAPFYHNLEIVTSATRWPDLPKEVARRASVNSSGFGGSNAHVIVKNSKPFSQPIQSSAMSLIPSSFSATTEQALRATLLAHTIYVRETSGLNHRDLSYIVSAKGSALSVRIAIASASTGDLLAKIEKMLEMVKADAGKPIGESLKWITEAPRFLGILIGQGSQWPGMGRELITQSAFVHGSMEDSDEVLRSLPEADRPSSWSLME